MDINIVHNGIPWNIILFHLASFVAVWIIIAIKYYIDKIRDRLKNKMLYLVEGLIITILGFFILSTYEFIFYAIDYSLENKAIITDAVNNVKNSNKGITIYSDKHNYRLLPKDKMHLDDLKNHCESHICEIEYYKWSKFIVKIKVLD